MDLKKNGVRITTRKANQFSKNHFSILLPSTSKYVEKDILTVYSVCTSHFPIHAFNLLKLTAYLRQQVLHLRIIDSAHTVFICFVFIAEQTPTCAPYNTN